jgi:hypothetical protein
MRRPKPPPDGKALERDPGLCLAARPKALSQSHLTTQRYLPHGGTFKSLRLAHITRGYLRVRFAFISDGKNAKAPERQPQGFLHLDLAGRKPAKGELSCYL